MSLRTRSGQPVLVLLKIGQQEHMEMLRRGLLYMNPLSYFRSLDHPARNDPHEGEDSIIQPSDIGEFTIDPGRRDFEKIRATPTDLAGPVRIALHQTSRCHVFCMFAITNPVEGPIFSQSCASFGDSVVLFTNTQEFLLRVKAAAERLRLNGEAALVQYYDESEYSGRLGRFKKPSIYSYQSEYRIVLETGVDGPFRFEIGDLRDITSDVLPLLEADQILKFGRKEAEEADLIW